jgi:hypothetical protein
MDLEGMARLASHEMKGALQHGARVPERPAAPAVGDGNVEQLGRRRPRRHLLRHVPYLQREVPGGRIKKRTVAGSGESAATGAWRAVDLEGGRRGGGF